MQRQTVSFTRNAANVFFHILTRCNLRCRHCYINPAQHGSNTLNIHTICKWLDTFTKRHPSANLILLGGEPTLHPDLAEAVHHARALGYASITIDTNGYLFHDILNKVTPDMVDVFSFSLDGYCPAVNDPLRGPGSFDVCTAGIVAAKKRGFSVSLICTVSTANIAHLQEMPALLEKLNVDRFFIQVIGIRGQWTDDADRCQTLAQVDRDTWMTVVPRVAEDAARRGIPTIFPKVFLNVEETFECAGKVTNNYFIFPNGRVYRCPLCEDYPLHSLMMEGDALVPAPRINEADLFSIDIAEGCVMNRIIQPRNLPADTHCPSFKIACCMLKEMVMPSAFNDNDNRLI
ncbi:radical SAM protein [Desulfosarcina sp. OttesenSCG-928-A07]|nr:radical SAM protein [Desulfosarcina sp. OttesenSCG-928-G17]MDL2328875.1 radical SAM protein [Desulfosarcina sp. OttesenSCG-928-A07]